MNVFILNTGRCGSTTFIKACEHISNYTAAHESRINVIGPDRLDYPKQHIEADNRLSWFLGRLDDTYGDNAFYVHLTRNPRDTVNSFVRRADFGIMKAYREGIYLNAMENDEQKIAVDYIETVNSNIRGFLRDKSRKMHFELEQAKKHFREFWKLINAEGDQTAALAEWDISHNQS